MRTWEDNEVPYGYLITFRTYGTWLHGDGRGSIDRYHNTFQGERVPANPTVEKQHAVKLKSAPVLLDGKQRKCVEMSIRGVCSYRHWDLHAINVRTNHAHTVVSAGPAKPEAVLRDFKAYSTRALKTEGL